MRSTCRSFLAAILFASAAGVVLAQDAAAVPPPSSAPVVKPAAELPAIPFVQPPAPAVEPALTADQTAAPLASLAVAPSATEKPIPTTGKRVTKKSARKPAAKPLVQVSQSSESVAPAAAVTVDASAPVPPPDTAASPALTEAIAPPRPPVKAAVVESRSEATSNQRTMGVGGWLLFGLGIVILFGVITLIRRRRTLAERQPSIVDFTSGNARLAPALVTRR